MPSIEELAKQTEELFGSLPRRGLHVVSRRLLGRPDQFRAGFAIRFADAVTTWEITYGDWELTVRTGETEVFGPSSHPGFAGNTFSPEHLAENLPRLALQIEPLLDNPSRDVV